MFTHNFSDNDDFSCNEVFRLTILLMTLIVIVKFQMIVKKIKKSKIIKSEIVLIITSKNFQGLFLHAMRK